MITYELARKLKEAGFPQHQDQYDDCGRFCVHKNSFANEHRESACAPSLSELIEACGEKFGELIRTRAGEWIALGDISSDRRVPDKALGGEFEKFAEAAVANLYLAIKQHSDGGQRP